MNKILYLAKINSKGEVKLDEVRFYDGIKKNTAYHCENNKNILEKKQFFKRETDTLLHRHNYIEIVATSNAVRTILVKKALCVKGGE